MVWKIHEWLGFKYYNCICLFYEIFLEKRKMFFLVFGSAVSRVIWWFLFPIWNEKISVIVLCQDMPAGWIGRIAWNEQYKCVYSHYNAQPSKWYRKSCFERNHSKMKAFEIVKMSNGIKKKNIVCGPRVETTIKADFMDYLHLKWMIHIQIK